MIKKIFLLNNLKKNKRKIETTTLFIRERHLVIEIKKNIS